MQPIGVHLGHEAHESLAVLQRHRARRRMFGTMVDQLVGVTTASSPPGRKSEARRGRVRRRHGGRRTAEGGEKSKVGRRGGGARPRPSRWQPSTSRWGMLRANADGQRLRPHRALDSPRSRGKRPRLCSARPCASPAFERRVPDLEEVWPAEQDEDVDTGVGLPVPHDDGVSKMAALGRLAQTLDAVDE